MAGTSLRQHGRLLLAPYVPRLALQWADGAGAPRWTQIQGTLVFVDISGFTALSERLAARGRIGAEQLTDVLNGVFADMLNLAYARNGMLLKFGGDALLLLFTGDDHPRQACAGAIEMRAALRQANTRRGSIGRLNLKMSVGIHSGEFVALRIGTEHQEMVLCGPGSTTTVLMEQTAEADDILVSPATAAALPGAALGASKGPGILLTNKWVRPAGPGPVAAPKAAYEQILSWIPEGLRRQLLSGSSESEHRFATIAFLRAEGTDTILASEGPEVLASRLNSVMTAVQAATRREGVTILATDIDKDGMKIILASGVPDATEDEAGRALRAVRRVMDTQLPLPLRAGINHGHVFAGNVGTDFRRTYTVMGDTVNLAARLMAAASPGTIYTTAAALDRSRTGFATVPLEPFRVKGKAEPIQAYSVGPEQGRQDVAAAHRLPCVGRDAEIALLKESLQQADLGSGRVVAIHGEAGVGKSRLVEEFLASIDPRPTLRVSGESYGVEVPYHTLRDALRAMLGVVADDVDEAVEQLRVGVERTAPEMRGLEPLLGHAIGLPVPETGVTEAMEPQFRRERLHRGIVQIVAAAYTGPTVLIVEDGHWVDQVSMDVIERISAEAKSRPWLVLVLDRGAPEPKGWVDHQMQLGRLSDDQARRLIFGATDSAPLRPHEVQELTQRAAGSPMFLELLIHGLLARGSAGHSASVDEVLNAEIDVLPPLARRFLRSV
ncbi:MAG: adenylate/guanylate cyclase domain-containing protein, partial [Dehalococcoidia bacterium]